jgi:hypothetical protein
LPPGSHQGALYFIAELRPFRRWDVVDFCYQIPGITRLQDGVEPPLRITMALNAAPA